MCASHILQKTWKLDRLRVLYSHKEVQGTDMNEDAMNQLWVNCDFHPSPAE
jgi:hypothetical protein